MKITTRPPKGSRLVIRAAEEHEYNRMDALLTQRHPQAAPARVGHELRLIIEQDGHWLGLMLWTSGCQHLQDRDEWIGWTHAQRAQRLKLIVQLRRYLLLHQSGTRPNLASEALAMAVRILPSLWQERFGFEPLLAESFSDIETQAGTCYRAAGWKAAGQSKGYAKHRGDLYSCHDRPKKIWLRPLFPQAVEWLRAIHLPARFEKGATASAHGQMPVKTAQMNSLSQALHRVADPRARNRQFPLGAVLSVIAMALLSGVRDISQIHRFSWRLSPKQREALGFRLQPGRKAFRMPGYSVYWSILGKLDLDAFANILSDWLSAHHGSLPAALALDGKMIRDAIGVLSLVDADTGVPVRLGVITQKEGDSDRCEKIAARRMVANMPDLQGALITGDALHADKTMATHAVANGADYLLQVKKNQPTVHKRLAATTAASPFLPSPRKPTDAWKAGR